jgi:hypothetical protein
MGLDTSYNNISEVLSLLQKYKQKMISHNGDNYTNKIYNMIYLDNNNKSSIKKNKVKYYVQYSGIKKKKGFKQTKTNKKQH